MIPLDGDFILDVAPSFAGPFGVAQRQIVGALAGEFGRVLASYGIDDYLRIAHFMAQVTHECAGFRTTEEFASGEAYEGREDIGNTEPGDGKRYKGRGLLQLTGRKNYRIYGELLGLPLEDQPRLAADPLTSLKIACAYFREKEILPDCDRDDLYAVTLKVNGRLRGLEDRQYFLTRAKTALARRQAIVIAAAQGVSHPIFRRGDFGEAVAALQERLCDAGLPVTRDGEFGPATELAVMEIQRARGLTVNGIVAREVWEALAG
ncbi:peptidoglycan-binding protein [Pseudoroseicyclus sp. CXY001]|uniref:peptidoglycan-binding protein n=1 Tax=Pseudoroseicyclus sp. CXY001 TaxID=3242492 RepID=UPI003570F248